jgi:hypothetical protein
VRLVTVALAFAGIAAGSGIEVCLHDRAGVGPRVLNAFGQELRALTGFDVDLRACTSPSRVRISVRTHAPSRYPAALGLAWVSKGKVLPVIEIYTMNIIHTLGRHAGAERFGRALARTAFHELQHHALQQHEHDDQGLFAAALNASALLALKD